MPDTPKDGKIVVPRRNILQRLVFWADERSTILERIEKVRADWFFRRFPISLWLGDSKRILDIGCGVGDLTQRLATTLPARVTAVDIEDFRRRGIREANLFGFMISDGGTLPFPDRTFDAVTILWVLHHAPDPERILREAHRVLQDGGSLTILEDVVADGSPLSRTLTRWHDALVNLEFEPHKEMYRSAPEWEMVVHRSGSFRTVERSTVPMYPGVPVLSFGVLRFRKYEDPNGGWGEIDSLRRK